MRKSRLLCLSLPAALIMVTVAVPWTAEAKPVPPVPPGGLTAKIIATSGQEIHGNIDATGYDIGVYIGPGTRNVRVQDARISGAKYEGILVLEASNIKITDNTVEHNGNPAA
jgi:parallel beta-helix repeat protein